MLLPALFSGQDIKIKGALSDDLYYQIENNITYLFSKVFSKKPIKIYPDKIESLEFKTSAVGTGFSGGIDSFTTVLQHNSDIIDSYKLTHLTLFNVGSYGNDLENSKIHFQNDINRAREFAEYYEKPLLILESNLNIFYSDNSHRIYNFSQRSTVCLISGVLAIQKLFKYYLIASSGIIDDFRFDEYDQYYYECLVASFLSNKNTVFIIAESDMDRVDKTKFIADNPIAQERLYVCEADIYNEKHGTNYNKNTAPNCSECIKCERTLITLDLLGKLDVFSSRFDLEKYKKNKDKVFCQVIEGHKRDHFLNEIYNLMKEVNFKIPFKYKVAVLLLKIKRLLARNEIIRVVYRFFLKK